MEKYLVGWESFLNELEAAPKAAVKSLKKFKDDMLGGGAESSEPFTKDGFPKDFSKPEEFSAPPGMEEHIVHKGSEYCLMSKKSNKNLGCYDTKAGAEKRERQVQYFKHVKEGEVEEDILFKPLSKNQRAHSSKLIRIKYKDKPMDADGIIDPEVAKGELEEKWSEKYKRSIDCKHPKGFSQKAHCQGRKKNEEIELEEKKDRCYQIAKRKYKAFPSAYASGAIVKCRQGKIWKKEK